MVRDQLIIPYQQIKKYGEVEIFQLHIPKLLQEWLTTQKSINRRWFKKQTAVEFLKILCKVFQQATYKGIKKKTR